MEDKVFDDIFRVVETLEPSTRFLEVEKGNKNLVMNNNFMIVEMPNGKARLLPHMLMINIYRGQTKDWLIQPNILRDNPSKEELIIDNIKIIDYELVLRSHPIVEMAIEETLDIDFESLAQHYGLKTNLVDFTFDIAVAAFFATNRYNSEKKTYEPVGKGIGIIYHDLSIAHNLDEYSPLGVQPFKRPHKQSAISIKVDDWSKYNQMVGKVKFYQNYEKSKLINEFFTGINKLFPKEDIVSITNEIIGLNKISTQAIDIYSEKHNMDRQDLIEIIKSNKSKRYTITDENIYKLSGQARQNIKRNLKGSIAEELGIISSSRLSF